jgi:hypothetical protein
MNKTFRSIAIVGLLAVAAAFTGCSTVQQTNPEATVYQIKANYAIALDGVIDYDQLPACEAATTVKGTLCATGAGTRALKAAKDEAHAAIAAAETAVRAPGASIDTTQGKLMLASSAVQGLINLVSNLQVKK